MGAGIPGVGISPGRGSHGKESKRPLGTEIGPWLTANKEAGILEVQLQRTEFGQRSERARKWVLAQSLQKGTQPGQHLEFSPVRP